MKISLYCLIIALILRGAFDYVEAQHLQIATPTPIKAEVIASGGKILPNGEFMPAIFTFTDILHGSWMEIGRINPKDDPNGFDPCFTYIKVNAKPIVRRIAKDKYEITFTSELSSNLP